MSNIFKKFTYLIFSTIILTNNVNAQSQESFSCLEDRYSFNQCSFEVPELKNGETTVIESGTGLFEGRLLVLCNNGKRSIISESCNYAQGEEDSCKGIPPNNWRGTTSECSHNYIATSVPNGDDFKVSSTNGNGYVTYKCEDTQLKVHKADCRNPDYDRILTTQSTGVQCGTETYDAEVTFDFLKNEYVPIPPSDVFCLNEGYDYLDSFALNETTAQIQLNQIATYSSVCCSTDNLDSPPQETIVTPINDDCANIQIIVAGEYNEITGEASNAPSDLTILNNVCKPNGYNQVTNYTASRYNAGNIVYVDEFEVEAVCCDNLNRGETNNECKGQFLSSGASAEVKAKALGIPYICDSSSGIMQCFQNSCTAFVQPAELCADCDLGNYSFNLNSNTCTVNMPLIHSGHETTEEFYNATHSGYVDVSCMNGQELVEDGRCFRNCLDRTVSWDNDAGTATCYQNLSDSKYRHYLTPTDNDRNNPNMEIGDKTGRLITIEHTGIAEFHCDDGQWVENSEDLKEPICFADCSATTGRWGTGFSKDGRDKTNACSANLSDGRHYVRPNYTAADPMANPSYDSPTPVTSINRTGSAQFQCNDGNWEIAGDQTCMLSCQAQRVSWTENGYTTYADVGASDHSDILRNIQSNPEAPNTGQRNGNRNLSSMTDLRCDDGRYIPIDPTVKPDCAAGSRTVDSPNYDNVCTFSWNFSRHGDSGRLGATGNGVGSADFYCELGNAELDNIVCNKTCDTETVEWPRTSGIGSNCPSGFSQSGNECTRTSSIAPSCTGGFTYNTATDQCERITGTTDTYPAVSECQSNYSDYSEDGYTCEKDYTTVPTCPSGWIFNGNECENPNPTNITPTWTCPPTSVAPSTPSGISAGGWNYRATYDEVTTTEIDGQCPSGHTFNSNTGMCESPCAEQCGSSIGEFFVYEHSEYGVWEEYEEDWTSNAYGDLYEYEWTNRSDPPFEEEWLRSGARWVSGGIQIGGWYYYPGDSTYSGGVFGGTETAELCRQPDSVLSGTCASSVEPTCPTGYELQQNGRCRLEETRLNVCIRDLTITPTCSSGHTWNGSQCVGSSSSTTPNYTCERGLGGIYHGLYPSGTLRDLTGQNISCSTSECCLFSEYNCNVNDWRNEPITYVCDWYAVQPTASCPSGTTLSGGRCTSTSVKEGQCPVGFQLSGSVCTMTDVIDANETCPDGSTAPCQSTPRADATCNPITLDTGARVTPNLEVPFCKYNHSVPNAATATCPSGGSPTGRLCYVNGSDVETEIPVCANGGTLTNDRCVATETVAAQSGEPVICSTTATSRSHTGLRSIVDSTTNGATGSATVSCQDGNWIVESAECYKDCNSTISASGVSTGTLEWETGDSLPVGHPAFGLSCSHNPISTSNYGHNDERNNISTLEPEKFIGEISYNCNDGFWEVSNSSCSRQACTGITGGANVSWTQASTCTTSSPTGLRWGDESTLNQPYGFSGGIDATVRCVDSGGFNVMNAGTAECYQDCDGTAGSGIGMSWNQTASGCYINYTGYMTHDTDSVRVVDTEGTARGRNYLLCDNGTLSFHDDTSCKPLIQSGRNVSWDDGDNLANGASGNCSGSLPEDIITLGNSFGAPQCTTVTDSTGDYRGSAGVCADSAGGLDVTSTSCIKQTCASKFVSWTSANGRNCSGTISAGDDGIATNVETSTAFRSGSAGFMCNNGEWSYLSGSCNADCTGGNQSFGSCTTEIYSISEDGESFTVNNVTNGYTGSVTLTCDDGTWTQSGASCSSTGCDATSLSWSQGAQNCSGNVGSGSDGNSLTVSNTASGYTGSVTATCSNGSWSTSSPLCNTNNPVFTTCDEADRPSFGGPYECKCDKWVKVADNIKEC